MSNSNNNVRQSFSPVSGVVMKFSNKSAVADVVARGGFGPNWKPATSRDKVVGYDKREKSFTD
jgi:hypothetical protein